MALPKVGMRDLNVVHCKFSLMLSVTYWDYQSVFGYCVQINYYEYWVCISC